MTSVLALRYTFVDSQARLREIQRLAGHAQSPLKGDSQSMSDLMQG